MAIVRKSRLSDWIHLIAVILFVSVHIQAITIAAEQKIDGQYLREDQQIFQDSPPSFEHQLTLSANRPIITNRINFTVIGAGNQIKEYQGTVTLDVNQEETQKIEFTAKFIRQTDSCDSQQCYKGWIAEYTANSQEPVQGFPESQQVEPVFSFDVNKNQKFNLKYDKDLQETWKQLIQISCQKFNPLYSFKQNKYTAHKNTHKPLRSFDIPNIRKTDFKIATNLKIKDLNTKKSQLKQTVSVNGQKLISDRKISYDVILDSEKVITEDGQQQPTLNGQIKINFKLTRSYRDSTNLNKKVNSLLQQKSSKLYILNKQKIEQRRTIQPNAFADWKVYDNQPTIQLIENRAIPGQILKPVDLSRIYDQASFTVLENSLKSRQAQDLISTVQIKQSFGELQTPNLDKDRLNPSLNRYFSLYSHKRLHHLFSSKNNSEHQQAVLSTINQVKTLYSKQILGKTVSLKVQVKCDLLFYATVVHARCTARLIYSIFGSQKTLSIFSFNKPINSNWVWNKDYSGNWAFSFAIPLPPPVSFITINFRISVGYFFKIRLFSKQAPYSPTQFTLGLLVQSGITTDSRASLRVIAIEGGVFVRGTLVTVGTDPSMIFAFLQNQKKLLIISSWYYWIIAFQFQWGFFWRYWRLFKGWTGIKIIKKWTINGVYQKYRILYKISVRDY